MGRMVLMDGSIAVVDGADPRTALTPRLPLTLAEPVTEYGAPTFRLSRGDVDVPVEVPGVDHGRLLLVDSDLVLQVRLDSPANSPITARRLWIEAGTATRLFLTPLGHLVDEGTATGGSPGTLEDTTKQWTYARLVSSRVWPPFRLSERSCRIRVGAHSAVLTLSALDLSGPQLASALQAAVDASALGPSRLTVTFDDPEARFAVEAVAEGLQPIAVEPYLQDGPLLEILGLLAPSFCFPGGEALDGYRVDLVSGAGAGQSRTVETNTSHELAVTQDWTTPPDATTTYRLTRPADGSVTVLAAR